MKELKQRTPEWLKFRSSKIGASDIAIIMGISPWKKPYDLWLEKLGFDQETKTNRFIERGNNLEYNALKRFNEEFRCQCIPSVIVHPKHEFFMASFDGLDAEKKISIEIKCPGITSHKKIQKSQKVPKIYIPQVLMQKEIAKVTERSYEHYFMSYRDDDNFTIFKVEDDDEYLKEIFKTCTQFWDGIINHKFKGRK